ncbi:hypothetical protein [uncultured Clostridium sp.]|uniref:DUF6903 family protein n=1 Tax=uncultured Clostridium sp. TaxID=59620 RepID=UPI0026090483|nr:hypothetical protein [uncultured Clostridium sp.]
MLKNVVKLILFVIAIILVIKGATIIGYTGLGMMFLGIAIILGELYIYNKQYT